MWQALGNAAASELEGNAQVLLSSYERLNAATVELHQRVKELMAAYPDSEGDALGAPPATREDGSEPVSLGQADHLLTRLCAKLPRVEEGTAPGTIFTPRAVPKGGLLAVNTGVSIVAGADKLAPLLTADVPALRWESTGGPAGTRLGPAAVASRPAQPPGPAVRGGASQRLAPKLVVSVDEVGAPEDPLRALQDYCDEVRSEAQGELRDLQAACGSPLGVHRRLLQDAVEQDSLPPPQAPAQWHSVRVREDARARVRDLMAAVVHTSKSPGDAWAALTECLMHGGVAEVPPEEPRGKPSGVLQGPAALTPDAFPALSAELRREGERWLRELLEKRDESDRGPLQDRYNAKDFAAFRASILPATHVQMVGQVLLYHAALHLPAMADLPVRAPDWTVRALYGRPFGEAVKAAVIQALWEAPVEPTAPAGSGAPEEGRQLDGKTERFLTPARQPSGTRAGQGSAQQATTAAAGNAADVAVNQALESMSRLADVFKDVMVFESVFTDIMAQPTSPRFLVHPERVSGSAPPQPPAPTPPPSAAAASASATANAYAAVVREEVARTMWEARPGLQRLVFGHLASAVQACLAAGEPLVEVPAATDAWPPVVGDGGYVGAAPRRIDAASQRVLLLVVWLQVRLGDYPETVQVILAGALLECLSLLMDRLYSSGCTAPRDLPPDPLPRLLLFHSAACCVRRRLELLLLPCGRMAGAAPDEHSLALVQQHGQCLVQADELVSSLHRHIVQAHLDTHRAVVLSCLARTDWGAFRPEVMRGQAAGPAVRVWHSLMMRMLHTAARISPLDAAEWMLGQVLHDSVASLADRYLQLCPSVQMLREYVGDVVHLVATTFLLCQPLPVRQPRARQEQEHQGGEGPQCLRLPHAMVAVLASTSRELLMRAALLHIPGAKLQQIATAVRLLPPYPAAAGAPAGAAPPAPPAQPVQLSAPAEQQPARSVEAKPSTTIPLPTGAAAGSTQPGNASGTQPGSARVGAGGVRLAPLPAINVLRASLSPSESAAGPVAEGQETERPSSSGGPTGPGEHPRNTTSQQHPAPSAGPQQRPTPPAASSGACTAPSGGSGGVGALGLPGDVDRCALWSSWLSLEVMSGLQAEAVGLDLGGEAAPAATRMMPLDDRMAESSPGGRAWRLCLERLAERASGEQVLLALARRCELHKAVGNEPGGHAESIEVVRGMARQMGLLREGEL